MIKWFKKNQNESTTVETPEEVQIKDEILEEDAPKEGFFSRFKHGLSKTRKQFGSGIGRLLLGKKN